MSKIVPNGDSVVSPSGQASPPQRSGSVEVPAKI